ncbi:MAG: hypothetical protein IJ017_06130 [Oscillospiraceae bacterium]|nr:hypothetical protein [Oscillospiraceae bacterium]
MASNLTPFYGLSLWQGTDNFSREDFNSDNSKIDTALANLYFKLDAMPWELAAYYQPNAERTSMSLSLEGVDLSKYLQLMLIVDLKADANADSSFYLRLNNISTGTYHKAGDANPKNYFMRTDTKSGYTGKRVIYFMPYEEGTYVCGNFDSVAGDDAGANCVTAEGVTWEKLTSVDYSAASITVSAKAGTGLYLFGIKKP